MRVLTYRGLDIGRHRAAFDKVCAAIERDDLRSPDVKKLSPSPYFRAKLDDSNRLIVQFLLHQGETVCLALEIVENHAYDRARFLRGAVVDEAAIRDQPVAASPEAAPIRFVHTNARRCTSSTNPSPSTTRRMGCGARRRRW